MELFEAAGVRTVLATEDGSRGDRGLVTASLAAALERADSDRVQIYTCGPTPMMHAVARIAAARRVPCEASLEQVMGCGLGGCYSCVVQTQAPGERPHYVRSCIDGPVFDAARVVWSALVH